MPELRYSKKGNPYLLLSEEEAAAEKAAKVPLPSTPEEWVKDAEENVARWRAVGENNPAWEPPEYDHWRLWVEYQWRQRRLKHTARNLAMELPHHVDRDGKLDLTALAAECAVSLKTAQLHLKALAGMGVDFSRLREWPHPLREEGG
jgi:hypothetical protein